MDVVFEWPVRDHFVFFSEAFSVGACLDSFGKKTRTRNGIQNNPRKIQAISFLFFSEATIALAVLSNRVKININITTGYTRSTIVSAFKEVDWMIFWGTDKQYKL